MDTEHGTAQHARHHNAKTRAAKPTCVRTLSLSFRQIPVVVRDASRSIEVGRGGGGGAAVDPQRAGKADGAPDIEMAVDVIHI